jgi:hypothetical protein
MTKVHSVFSFCFWPAVFPLTGKKLIAGLPNNSIIAVVSMLSQSIETSEYIVHELEYQLVNSGKFTVVERRLLDQIKTEQNFQMSGNVSDASAISIGHLLGASIVIVGDIYNFGAAQTLNIKALDVKTGRIITIAREQF